MSIVERTRSLFHLKSGPVDHNGSIPAGHIAQPVCATTRVENVDFDFYDSYTKDLGAPVEGLQAHIALVNDDGIVTFTFWTRADLSRQYFGDVLSRAVQEVIACGSQRGDFIRDHSSVLTLWLGKGATSCVAHNTADVLRSRTFLRTTCFALAGADAQEARQLVDAIYSVAEVGLALQRELLLHATLFAEDGSCKTLDLWSDEAAGRRFTEDHLRPAFEKLLSPEELQSVVNECAQARVFWVSEGQLDQLLY